MTYREMILNLEQGGEAWRSAWGEPVRVVLQGSTLMIVFGSDEEDRIAYAPAEEDRNADDWNIDKKT